MHKDSGRPTGPNRRAFLKGAAGLAAFGLAPPALAQSGAARGSGAAQNGPATSGTRLVLLGTRGGPGVELTRGEAASAVVVEGTPYLVDCGYGTLRALVASGLGYNGLGTIFFTHLHDDHTSDLAALLSHQWTGNRAEPTNVYGPHGTAALVEAAIAFFRANVEIRIVDEGRTTLPETLFLGHDLPATATPAEALKDERVAVTAIENTHYPERSKAKMPHRALSYRFDTRDRSIVFSGDTAYSKNLVELARGADLFVCEILDQGVHARMQARAQEAAAAGNPENLWRHVAETHSTPADVGRMASEANVKTVVLNHLLPGARTSDRLEFPVTAFVDGVRETFSGNVIVGQDLMVL
jgi:ribonuclease BN (tRNA processing enzyme)